MKDRIVSTISFSHEASKILRTIRPKNLSFFVSKAVTNYARDSQTWRKKKFVLAVEELRQATIEAFGMDIEVKQVPLKR